MPYELRGKGVITGISIAKVMKLGEDLQSYIDAYTPGTAEEEVSKIKEALAYAAEVLSALPAGVFEGKKILIGMRE